MEQTVFDALEDSGETYLTQRFGRPAPIPEKLAYEFTRDAGFNHQYILLRDGRFSAGNGDAFDVTSEIIVARRGLHCIAGGRLTLSAPSYRQALPMEKNGVDPQQAMPKLNLNDHAYGELSRLAILPEFEDSEVLPSAWNTCSMLPRSTKQANAAALRNSLALNGRYARISPCPQTMKAGRC